MHVLNLTKFGKETPNYTPSCGRLVKIISAHLVHMFHPAPHSLLASPSNDTDQILTPKKKKEVISLV
jgi:hypothetical protein